MQVNEHMDKSSKLTGKCEGDSTSGFSSAAITAAAKRSRRLAIRTRFCDDFFEDCVISRGIKQVGTIPGVVLTVQLPVKLDHAKDL